MRTSPSGAPNRRGWGRARCPGRRGSTWRRSRLGRGRRGWRSGSGGLAHGPPGSAGFAFAGVGLRLCEGFARGQAVVVVVGVHREGDARLGEVLGAEALVGGLAQARDEGPDDRAGDHHHRRHRRQVREGDPRSGGFEIPRRGHAESVGVPVDLALDGAEGAVDERLAFFRSDAARDIECGEEALGAVSRRVRPSAVGGPAGVGVRVQASADLVVSGSSEASDEMDARRPRPRVVAATRATVTLISRSRSAGPVGRHVEQAQQARQGLLLSVTRIGLEPGFDEAVQRLVERAVSGRRAGCRWSGRTSVDGVLRAKQRPGSEFYPDPFAERFSDARARSSASSFHFLANRRRRCADGI